MLYSLGSQAGVADINHAFHLYYKCCMWIEFQSISTLLRGFSPGTPVSSLLKINSQSNPSGCGAVPRSHIWIKFRGRAPNRQHSFFGPTSLSCALCNSVYGLRARVISRSSSSSRHTAVTFSLDLGTDKSKFNACKTEHSITSFETVEIKMTAVSVKLSIRDPYSNSKATLCHFGEVIAVGFNLSENAAS